MLRHQGRTTLVKQGQREYFGGFNIDWIANEKIPVLLPHSHDMLFFVRKASDAQLLNLMQATKLVVPSNLFKQGLELAF